MPDSPCGKSAARMACRRARAGPRPQKCTFHRELAYGSGWPRRTRARLRASRNPCVKSSSVRGRATARFAAVRASQPIAAQIEEGAVAHDRQGMVLANAGWRDRMRDQHPGPEGHELVVPATCHEPSDKTCPSLKSRCIAARANTTNDPCLLPSNARPASAPSSARCREWLQRRTPPRAVRAWIEPQLRVSPGSINHATSFLKASRSGSRQRAR
jgi:hypothetical protein